jgi:hypothetical protein
MRMSAEAEHGDLQNEAERRCRTVHDPEFWRNEPGEQPCRAADDRDDSCGYR